MEGIDINKLFLNFHDDFSKSPMILHIYKANLKQVYNCKSL